MSSDPRLNILIVDDQPGNLLALEAALAELGQNIVKARSGIEALRCLLDHDIAMILLDVQMPDMDGFETAALIRERDRSRQTPIIFLTAYDQDEVQLFKGYSLGAVDYLFKPIVPQILRSKVMLFVELLQKTAEIGRQSELLRENQRREHERALVEERRRWEIERLREEAEKEKRITAALTQRTEELALTIAERARVEEQLRIREHQQAVVADLGQYALAGAGLDDLMKLAVARAAETLQVEHCGVLQSSGSGTTLRRIASSGCPENLGTEERPAPAAAPLSQTGEPKLVPQPALHAANDLAALAGMCGVSVMIHGQSRPFGMLECHASRHEFTQDDVHFLQAVANVLAAAIQRKCDENELREADRRKDEFLAMLGHELRNPLAPILNTLHLLQHAGSDPGAWEQAHEILERQARHLALLVEDLLDVSRISSGKIQLRKSLLSLNQAVQSAIETARPFLDAKNHAFTAVLPQETLRIVADPARIEQVIANLLNNAAKYTEPGGQITLTLEHEGSEAVVLVEDNGIGISPEMLSCIFEIFTQADRSIGRSEGGLGVGLTLVRRLVELHEGTVRAHSAGLSKGSTFEVRLPLWDEEPDDDAPLTEFHAEAVELPEHTPRRVLVVDDNVDGALTLSRLIRLWGHEVAITHDGPSALEMARTQAPDVVLLDIAMPGMSGHELAQRLRAMEGMDPPLLVALSGFGQSDDLRRSQEAGIHHHLVKPVNPDALRQILAEHQPLERSNLGMGPGR